MLMGHMWRIGAGGNHRVWSTLVTYCLQSRMVENVMDEDMVEVLRVIFFLME